MEGAQVVWYGGRDKGQDVSVRLVHPGSGCGKDEHHLVTVAELKMHSSHLNKCSKYFETLMSERWKKLSTPSLEFVLEVQADTECYKDCFSRMYSPLRKGFKKDVKYSLALLKVASQIEFHDLMVSVSQYVSTIKWSEADEIRIREYSSSPDFPRNHAEDLVARLGLDVSEEDCHKQLCDKIHQCTRAALCLDGTAVSASSPARAFLQELLMGIGSSISSDFGKTVVMIVSREAKDMFVNVGKECFEKDFHDVPNITDKLLALSWVLETLLKAEVAEELVQCIAHLDIFSKILGTQTTFQSKAFKSAAFGMSRLVDLMYSQLVAGRLLLKIQDRVALLKNWNLLLRTHMKKEGVRSTTKTLFSTFPLKQQLELINFQRETNEEFIAPSSFATLVKKSWPVMGSKRSAFQPIAELTNTSCDSTPSVTTRSSKRNKPSL
ncbi:uncharacterized protein [Physcomitrium patens]|nr:uncharacterized protein LOC112296115 [Physcomitrium patens]XP_024404065.1 uncharacterized protein LOC112296115 [Physcomitrium patens]XP_024404066.1 uncharacterized protein LOC112296115 [Physcomitrium patens]XP_024404067.1 uncharacterized protein LOC112296115 [Physcomitrium patens]XP_024404068.1 uncharacterized protein LOC112296115 [Physcomitrium patens]XP_024404070.1 uncharacterized protein LOC112296115 [Physcomitrium patens]PNR34387.1 hypothetical protein PHYPA_024204 [Physcomitrium paten|eukprot:XP_024404064.1 uncharacterized protein LOC112296115 [Physcomitrella patens]